MLKKETKLLFPTPFAPSRIVMSPNSSDAPEMLSIDLYPFKLIDFNLILRYLVVRDSESKKIAETRTKLSILKCCIYF